MSTTASVGDTSPTPSPALPQDSFDQLQDAVYEVRSRAEEIVITKQARVIEEIVLNKVAGERTEVIMDTVRHTDVNVVDLQVETQTGAAPTATATTTEQPYTPTEREGELVFPIIDERITVSKRPSEGGGVRVEVRTTTTPVREEIMLGAEDIQVERRTVDRLTTTNEETDLRPFLWEIRERAERIEVVKQGRVIEELVLSKAAQDRVETIQDTLRHTDVAIEELRVDQPQAPLSTGGMGSAGGEMVAPQTDENNAVIPVIEESLSVGKRVVEVGGVRLQPQITETPFQEQITLRSETVSFERRPVDRPITGDEIAGVQQGVFELREHNEAAVVQRSAMIVEEVVVNKEAHERTEVIEDVVRRVAVNIQELEPETRTSLDPDALG